MTKKKDDARLHWLKFNPSEYMGICSGLEDAEIGLFHRIVEKLWATPGNSLLREDLMHRLRIKKGSEAEERFDGLIGCVIFVDESGFVSIPKLQEAFQDAISRSESAKAAAGARWNKTKDTKPEVPRNDNDFDPNDLDF